MPGDKKIQAPNPLSAEITSVETDFIRAKQIAKVNFFFGGMEGWVVVLILFVIGVLEIGTCGGVSLQYQNQLKIYTIMKGQLELQFSENEVMINEKTSRRARRASKAAEEARNERDVYLVSLLVAFFIAMFI